MLRSSSSPPLLEKPRGTAQKHEILYREGHGASHSKVFYQRSPLPPGFCMLGCLTRARLGDATHPRASLSHLCASQGATWRCHRCVPLATSISCCSFGWDGAREHAPRPEQGKVAENNRRGGNRWQQRPASRCRPLSAGQTPCTEMILPGDALPVSVSQPLPMGGEGLGWGGGWS